MSIIMLLWYLAVGAAVALWRVCWKGIAILAAAVCWWKVEQEFENQATK